MKIRIPDTSITMTSCDRIQSICQWMFDQFDLTYFDYGRYYNNGQSFHLVNDEVKGLHRSFMEHYYGEGIHITIEELEQIRALYNNPLQMMSFFNIDFTVTDELELSSRLKYRDNIQLGKQYNIDKRFYLGTRHKEYVEIVGFGVGPYHDNFCNACLQTLPALRDFIQYFRHAAKDVIETAEKCTLTTSVLTNSTEFQQPNLFVKYDFLRKCKTNIRLTHQESACVQQLLHGKTFKETAKVLNLSPRTVESYVNNIKNKAGYDSTSELLNAFRIITYG